MLLLTLLAFVFFADAKHYHKFKIDGQNISVTQQTLVWPGQPYVNFRQYSGYVNVNETVGANLFYIVAESQRNPSQDPVALWMTGGPGCSSELAFFFENGPFQIEADGTMVPNNNSWNKVATMIFVDQPVGTGFSYLENPNGYVTTERQMAQELFVLIQGVLSANPQYNQGQEFFIFGESYAGHYVPAISEKIMQSNKRKKRDGGVSINFKGLAIGNGMTSPLIQYGEYADFSFAHGLISLDQRNQLEQTYKLCKKLLLSSDPRGANATNVCQSILDNIQEFGGNFNVYDVTKSCIGSLCYPMQPIVTYLNQPAVLKELGVPANMTFEVCDGKVYAAIATPDWFNQEAYTIPVLLDEYRVLIYAGSNDWICNRQGNYEWVSKLSWNYRGEWNAANRTVWSDSTGMQVKGYSQTYGGLTFVAVTDAGHMVPHDQPENALELFTAFLNNQPLQSPSKK